MRPYFTTAFTNKKRLNDVSNPDVADCHKYGLKSSKNKVAGKGGDRNSGQHTGAKQAARRRGNKAARAALKNALKNEVE